MTDILLVEDDDTFIQILTGFLKKHGHHVDVVRSVKEAITLLSKYKLIILDYRLPDGTGLDILEHAHTHGIDVPAIMMTSFNDTKTAVKAMRWGAIDYITKPINPDELLLVLNGALKQNNNPATAGKNVSYITGNSQTAKQLYEYIDIVAPTNMAVIIEGESGTGKEHVAKVIHQKSKRSNAPFVAIDCGVLTDNLGASELFGYVKGAFTGAVSNKKGQFELASGGTVFLDEVGNLNYDVQVKLLRAIQEKEIQPLGASHTVKTDIRIIVATNDDLLKSVKAGKFREDLYHRLNEFKIKIPALRERGDDLDIFISHFINEANHELGRHVTKLNAEARELFYEYKWPGNLRQLKNVIKRVVLLSNSSKIGKELLPDEILWSIRQMDTAHDGPNLKLIHEATEKELIRRTLHEVKYNKSKAAQLLNIDRKTLYNKLAKYGID